MKGKTISIHSSRGGTGKTVIATNLAIALASKGANVALLDMDFRAPSLSIVFANRINQPVSCWLNDYLDNRCATTQAVIELKTGSAGKLLLGLANPSVDAITAITEKSRDWEVTALKKLFALKKYLTEEKGVDYCILDTSPGIQYSSVNAAVASDATIMVTTLDSIDIEGVKNLILDLYDNVAKNTFILLNKVSPETTPLSCTKESQLIKNTEEMLGHKVIGLIPCYCQVLQAGRASFLVENYSLPFTKTILGIVANLEQFFREK